MTSNEPLHRHPAYDRDGGRGCRKPFQLCSPVPSRSDYRVAPYGPCPFLSVKRIGASVRRARRTYLEYFRADRTIIHGALPFRESAITNRERKPMGLSFSMRVKLALMIFSRILRTSNADSNVRETRCTAAF